MTDSSLPIIRKDTSFSESDIAFSLSERLSEKLEDDRIDCTNGDSLNEILQIAIDQAVEVADSNQLTGNARARFINRFTEVFRTVLQSNVTVGGLPWEVSPAALTPEERGRVEAETDDALLSTLATSVEGVSRRRKRKDAKRVMEMRFKHRRQNLRNLKVESLAPHAFPPLPRGEQKPFPHEVLAEICNDVNDTQEKIDRMCHDLPALEGKLEYALNVLGRENELIGNETGYYSE